MVIVLSAQKKLSRRSSVKPVHWSHCSINAENSFYKIVLKAHNTTPSPNTFLSICKGLHTFMQM
jgi:hypothetical protein